MSWIKLHRKFTKWEWYTDVNTCHLFLHLLVSANHDNKKWRGIEIKRGQILTSLPSLSEGTGLSVQEIRTAIAKLESTGEIINTSTSSYRILTIVKYEEYQASNSQATDESIGTATDEQQTSNRQSTATKERKEVKEDNNKNNNTREKPKKTKQPKITLDELSVDHVKDWLHRKRCEGRYLQHDEHFILEQFKDYCHANGKKYDDYCAAFRNAFEWERFNKSRGGNSSGKQQDGTNRDRLMSAIFNA